MKTIVSPGQKWLHKNGAIYRVIHVANQGADKEKRREYPEMIVYINDSDPSSRVWAKKTRAFVKSRTFVADQ